MKRFLLLICLVVLATSQDWDYKKGGDDWDAYSQCMNGAQAPINILLENTSPLDPKYYFYPKTNNNVKGSLQHEQGGNLLVLNFTEKDNVLGLVDYEDDWGRQTQNCSAIFFKLPGEHTFEDEGRPEMELQLNCSIFSQSTLSSTFVSIPVKLTKDESEQSTFFNSLKTIVDQQIDENKLPVDITVDTFGDLMDGFSVLDGAYIYEAQVNFPPCATSANYIYIHRYLKVGQSLYDQLKKCLKSDKVNPDTGNARNLQDETEVFEIGVFQA